MSNKNISKNLQDKKRKINIFSIIASVLAAMFGVQNSKNHKRDFSYRSATPFIIVGIIAVILFILFLILVVKLVLNNHYS